MGAKGGGFGGGWGKDALSLLKASKRSMDCLKSCNNCQYVIEYSKPSNYLPDLTKFGGGGTGYSIDNHNNPDN